MQNASVLLPPRVGSYRAARRPGNARCPGSEEGGKWRYQQEEPNERGEGRWRVPAAREKGRRLVTAAV